MFLQQVFPNLFPSKLDHDSLGTFTRSKHAHLVRRTLAPPPGSTPTSHLLSSTNAFIFSSVATSNDSILTPTENLENPLGQTRRDSSGVLQSPGEQAGRALLTKETIALRHRSPRKDLHVINLHSFGHCPFYFWGGGGWNSCLNCFFSCKKE